MVATVYKLEPQIHVLYMYLESAWPGLDFRTSTWPGLFLSASQTKKTKKVHIVRQANP